MATRAPAPRSTGRSDSIRLPRSPRLRSHARITCASPPSTAQPRDEWHGPGPTRPRRARFRLQTELNLIKLFVRGPLAPRHAGPHRLAARRLCTPLPLRTMLPTRQEAEPRRPIGARIPRASRKRRPFVAHDGSIDPVAVALRTRPVVTPDRPATRPLSPLLARPTWTRPNRAGCRRDAAVRPCRGVPGQGALGSGRRQPHR